MRNTANFCKRFIRFFVIGTGWLLLSTSCEKTEITRSIDEDYETESLKHETGSIDIEEGISFEMESDSLDEDIEEVHFHANEWEEEGMAVDL